MLRRVKSLNFSVSGESLPAEATKQKWRLKLRPAMSMTLNTPLASSEWVMPSTMPRSMSWLSSAFSMSRELPLVSDTSICGNRSVNSASICGSTYCATVVLAPMLMCVRCCAR